MPAKPKPPRKEPGKSPNYNNAKLLRYLHDRRGELVTYEELMAFYGLPVDDAEWQRSFHRISMYVSRLRRNPMTDVICTLHNVPNKGYVLHTRTERQPVDINLASLSQILTEVSDLEEAMRKVRARILYLQNDIRSTLWDGEKAGATPPVTHGDRKASKRLNGSHATTA